MKNSLSSQTYKSWLKYKKVGMEVGHKEGREGKRVEHEERKMTKTRTKVRKKRSN